VIVSDIEKVSCEVYQNEKMLGVPVRGYFAISRRVHRKEWEDSIRWCSTELEHLTWTKISGGIRCWDQFNYDRDDVNDPKSTVGVLAMWGTRSYFDARGSAWEFHGTLELPERESMLTSVPAPRKSAKMIARKSKRIFLKIASL
jgi:hypothetical protein